MSELRLQLPSAKSVHGVSGDRYRTYLTGVSATAAAAPAGPDVKGFEKDLAAYYQSLGGKPLDPQNIQALASKYNVGEIGNLPAIEEFYKTRGRLNPTVQRSRANLCLPHSGACRVL